MEKEENEELLNKIKSFLYSTGISEQYIAFDYTAEILSYFFSTHQDNFRAYQQALDNLKEKYNVSHRALCHSINALLKKCKIPQSPSKKKRTFAQLQILKKIFEIKSSSNHFLN